MVQHLSLFLALCSHLCCGCCCSLVLPTAVGGRTEREHEHEISRGRRSRREVAAVWLQHHAQHAAGIKKGTPPAPKTMPTLRCLCLCLCLGQRRRHQLATRRKQGGAAAACAHKAFSPVACSTACRRAIPALASKMDDAADDVCVRASAHESRTSTSNKDGSMRPR